jgi:hypothetical protein
MRPIASGAPPLTAASGAAVAPRASEEMPAMLETEGVSAQSACAILSALPRGGMSYWSTAPSQ